MWQHRNEYHSELISISANPDPNWDLGRPDLKSGQVAIWVRTILLRYRLLSSSLCSENFELIIRGFLSNVYVDDQNIRLMIFSFEFLSSFSLIVSNNFICTRGIDRAIFLYPMIMIRILPTINVYVNTIHTLYRMLPCFIELLFKHIIIIFFRQL